LAGRFGTKAGRIAPGLHVAAAGRQCLASWPPDRVCPASSRDPALLSDGRGRRIGRVPSASSAA
ncbi:MAG: hypothetical protein LBQ12_08220, partial [Deltaproteobacteria bacterium]|nr:hypothetical protein [Deltaproteobacteria bacterium]